MSPPRISWDTWAIGIARAVSLRATCNRLKVGALVLDPNRRIAGLGYNGSALAGAPHCGPECSPDGPPCTATVHAEANALVYAGPVPGGTLYCTHCPCVACVRLACTHGIGRIVYEKHYRGEHEARALARGLGVTLESIDPMTELVRVTEETIGYE